MKKNILKALLLSVIVFTILLISHKNSHGEYIKIAGFTQGTTYHITYRSPDGRNLQQQIDSLLADFDLSASIYLSNSIISRINNNDPDVQADKKFYIYSKNQLR
jgi:thiamine biosynthesis lipoprotein